MARDLYREFLDGFQEYQGKYTDEDGDEHPGTPVRAHVITNKDFNGYEVVTLSGVHRVHAGDAVVERDRPGVYDVVSRDVWEKTGYAGNGPADNSKNPQASTSPQSPASSGSTDKASVK